jgi:hypothetical protein
MACNLKETGMELKIFVKAGSGGICYKSVQKSGFCPFIDQNLMGGNNITY